MNNPDTDVTPKAAAALRAFASTLTPMFDKLMPSLDEGMKARFAEIKGEITTTLASLPGGDLGGCNPDNSAIVGQLTSALQRTQSLIESLSTALTGKATDLANVRASMPGEIQKAIEAKVTAGEYLTKDSAKKLADDAVSAARSGWITEQKNVADRRTALATASLPVPASDEPLMGDDAAFNSKKQKATERVEKLKTFATLSPARVAELAWGYSDEAFNSTVEILTEAKGSPKPSAGGGPNPLAGGSGGKKPLGAF